jgi:poly(3-hydroxyoctanoate) depolymerase
MVGVIAMQVALNNPELITHLILTVTSGGLNVNDLRAEDWRLAFLDSNPSFPRWFTDYKSDLSANLRSIKVPILPIWGDAVLISPVAVGERLRDLLPHASLHVLPNGAHDLTFSLASNVAPLIDEHLSHAVKNYRYPPIQEDSNENHPVIMQNKGSTTYFYFGYFNITDLLRRWWKLHQ